MSLATARSLYRASNRDYKIVASQGGWYGFNDLLASVLNLHAAGQATHFCMLHADIECEDFWVDVLVDEVDRLHADLISVAVPIKDFRGVTSCGIQDPTDRWHPLKRFTMREIYDLPETFGAAEAGYPGMGLLHNNGCFCLDLRSSLFHELDEQGVLKARFDFPREVFRGPSGAYDCRGESEDWYFSRAIHDLGAKTFITRKVKLTHCGGHSFPNTSAWGIYDSDEDSEARRAAANAG